MLIAIIDGMGGGIGNQLITNLRQEKIFNNLEIVALGTNSIATGNMMKAKANYGATGENAIKFNVEKADFILGSLSIIIPNSMYGEITPIIATTISSANAKKILLPIPPKDIKLIGIEDRPLFLAIKDVIATLRKFF